MRYPAPDPVKLKQPDWIPYWASAPMGPLAQPGLYKATLMKRQDGELVALSDANSFTLKSMANSPEISKNPEKVLAFKQQLAELQRSVNGANKVIGEMSNRIKHLIKAVDLVPMENETAAQEIRTLSARLTALKIKFSGDSTISSRQEAVPWSISQRVGSLYGGLIESQADIPGNYKESMKVALSSYSSALKELHMIEADLTAFEQEAEENGAPWTPGRLPSLGVN